jgi:hypothetical protein
MPYHLRSSRQSAFFTSMTFLYLGWISPIHAGELPSDIWNGGHGGFPSVTVNRSGVSVTIPQQAIADAGGGSIDTLVKGFLDRWAPEICTDLFDFQHSHEKMTLRVAVYSGGSNPGTYGEIVINYRPSHDVNCVQPDLLVW